MSIYSRADVNGLVSERERGRRNEGEGEKETNA